MMKIFERKSNYLFMEDGNISVLALFIISGVLLFSLAVLSLFFSHKALLYTKTLKRTEQEMLRNISMQILQDIENKDKITQLKRTNEDISITVKDYSGGVHPVWIDDFWFEFDEIEQLFSSKEAMNQFLITREISDSIIDYSAYKKEDDTSFFSGYSYININIDSLRAIEVILIQNNVEEENIKNFINALKTNRSNGEYINDDSLVSLLDMHNIPLFIQAVFKTDALININSIDITLLEQLLKHTIFQITNSDDVLEFIRTKRNNGDIITVEDMRKEITTQFDDQFFFWTFGDTSWFYGTEVCNEIFCHTQIITRRGKSNREAVWQVIEDRIEQR